MVGGQQWRRHFHGLANVWRWRAGLAAAGGNGASCIISITSHRSIRCRSTYSAEGNDCQLSVLTWLHKPPLPAPRQILNRWSEHVIFLLE